ncbi:MAG: fluoride efflux transporter CrcB [Gammaproteobacteria bacterium]|nr:MAG: fluoride efflux transporter CrcB [Gammaproteobacteria bacterium]
MKHLLVIATGGAAGAVFRYGLSSGIAHWFGKGFPLGTLTVNVVGSGLMGFLYVLMLQRVVSEEWRLALLTGLLGAFTTFSTFSVETLNLFQDGAYAKAGGNIILSVFLCLFAAWLGMFAGKQI